MLVQGPGRQGDDVAFAPDEPAVDDVRPSPSDMVHGGAGMAAGLGVLALADQLDQQAMVGITGPPVCGWGYSSRTPSLGLPSAAQRFKGLPRSLQG